MGETFLSFFDELIEDTDGCKTSKKHPVHVNSCLLHEVLSRKSLSSMFEFHREEDIGDSMFSEDSLE